MSLLRRQSLAEKRATIEVDENAPDLKGRSQVLFGIRLPAWRKLIPLGLVLAVVAFVGVHYKFTASWSSLEDPHAMDVAQVAKNMAYGSGFTTRLVRPLNVAVVDDMEYENAELGIGPLYPRFAAALFALRGSYDQVAKQASIFSLVLAIGATYFLGTLLFDKRIAVLAASLLGLSVPVLRAGTSGMEWSMAALVFTGMLCFVAAHHRAVEARRPIASIVCAALTGVAFATLYSISATVAIVLVPLVVYFARVKTRRRLNLVAFILFAAVLSAPYAWHNQVCTGFPILGMNAWNVAADTSAYPADILYRTADQSVASHSFPITFCLRHFPAFSEKLLTGSGEVLTHLASVIGLAALGFAVVSALYRFKRPETNAVRGLLYAVIPLLAVSWGALSAPAEAVVTLAPALAVFAAGYFFLLLDARKLHPFYSQCVVGGLLFVTAFPALASIVSGVAGPIPRTDVTLRYFRTISDRGVSETIYTDVPWLAAWITDCTAVWLPRADADIDLLASRGMPMRVVIITSETEKYGDDEIWYVLRNVKAWREYVRDPEIGLEKILDEAGIHEQERREYARKFLPRLKRRYAVSESISGFIATRFDPLLPDEIQVFRAPL